MFFFRCKKTASQNTLKAPPVYTYWLTEDSHPPVYEYGFELNYSGEVGDAAFSAICSQILCDLFSEYWVSAWINNPHTPNFLLPDGQRSGKKECFSAAYARYLRRRETDAPVLFNKKTAMVSFSEGIYLPVLNAYLSDISPEYPTRWIDFFGYETPFEPTISFDKERQRRESLPYAVMAQNMECSDELDFLITSPGYDKNAIRSAVQRACDSFGRELRIYPKNAKQ